MGKIESKLLGKIMFYDFDGWISGDIRYENRVVRKLRTKGTMFLNNFH
ncbi:MAG: hypothetical protein LBH43_04670 [Treponema sp.]|jgi:hypothetical protein|nr:hypothetical protein [Treponema sp.]